MGLLDDLLRKLGTSAQNAVQHVLTQTLANFH